MNSYVEEKKQLAEVVEHFTGELDAIRAGRVTPSTVERVPVAAYGTRSPLFELASITSPEPNVLLVQPWDTSILRDIERALTTADVGVAPVVQGEVIRLPFPPLTEERRRELAKRVDALAEEARVAVRRVREAVMKRLKADETAGTRSEDAAMRARKECEAMVEEHLAAIGKRRTDKYHDLGVEA